MAESHRLSTQKNNNCTMVAISHQHSTTIISYTIVGKSRQHSTKINICSGRMSSTLHKNKYTVVAECHQHSTKINIL